MRAPPTAAGTTQLANVRPGASRPAASAADQMSASALGAGVGTPAPRAHRAASTTTGSVPGADCAREVISVACREKRAAECYPHDRGMDIDIGIPIGKARRPILTYGTYPFLLVATIAVLVGTVHNGWDPDKVMGLLALGTIIVTFVVERLNPLRTEWQMTKDRLIHRDLPFIGLAVIVEQLLQVAAQYVAIHLVPPGGFGLLAKLPLIGQIIFALIATDLLWYAYHRTAHTWGSLWRFHSVHHSPSQVYVFVHQVFHPMDLFFSRFVVTLLAMSFTGISPMAAFCAIVIINLQQTVSHMNSDQRVGWLNYILIGTETHRYHHSALHRGNYSSAIPLWDQVFGTFVYRPREIPGRLGLDDPSQYPDPRKFHRTLAWPFSPSLVGTGGDEAA